ncbi:MAG TPA: metal ABC transporter ATP-binding protein [Streptosporangiaceae bacterium]|nr:metal ABC transporter ATP-binding protein [Streptosporangiaceae bacterium]
MSELMPSAAPEELLRLDGVTVRLGGREVLHDVGFTIRPGEFTGLIGPNGAGKTTILRVILGLLPPSAGTVTVAGRPIGGHRHRRGESVIGYVPQKLLIEPDMPLRVRDVVALGIDGNRLGVPFPSRARRELVAETLRAVGADSYADARVGELSGGEQQRVMIAHALISRPRLLLLDEPLANLDIRSAQGIVAVLARLAREQHIAVLISAHDMNPLASVMDRIVYVAGGRAAVGSSEEVLRTDVLSRLYGQHVDVLHVHGRVVIVAGESGEDTGSPDGLSTAPDPVYGSGVA